RGFGNSRLLSDDELELGDKIEEQRSVRGEGLTKLLPPLAKLGLGLAQKLPEKALERLGQRGVGNVAPELLELARGEQAARWDQHLVQLVHDRGLADARAAAHEHQ